jgi:hypothetical protein
LPLSEQSIESITAQVQWLQEFCDHLVENSLLRSLQRANAAKEAKEAKERGESTKKACGGAGGGAKRKKGEGADGDSAGGGGGAEKKKRSRKAPVVKDEGGAEGEAEAEAEEDADLGEEEDELEMEPDELEADSMELCGAFATAEGGPPTPLDEPLPWALREAMTHGDGASRPSCRQISSILMRASTEPGDLAAAAAASGTRAASADAPSGAHHSAPSGAHHSAAAADMDGGSDMDEVLIMEGEPLDSRPSSTAHTPRGARDGATALRTADADRRLMPPPESTMGAVTGAGGAGPRGAVMGAGSSGGVGAGGGALASGAAARASDDSPLSPTGPFAFDVDDLLRIVSCKRARDAREASPWPLASPRAADDLHASAHYGARSNGSPRAQPLFSVAASPVTRGPLEALWMCGADPLLRRAVHEAEDDEEEGASGGSGGSGGAYKRRSSCRRGESESSSEATWTVPPQVISAGVSTSSSFSPPPLDTRSSLPMTPPPEGERFDGCCAEAEVPKAAPTDGGRYMQVSLRMHGVRSVALGKAKANVRAAAYPASAAAGPAPTSWRAVSGAVQRGATTAGAKISGSGSAGSRRGRSATAAAVTAIEEACCHSNGGSASFAPAAGHPPSHNGGVQWRPAAAAGLRLVPSAFAADGGLARKLCTARDGGDGENGDGNAGAGCSPSGCSASGGLLSACASLGMATCEGGDLSGFLTRWIDMRSLTSPGAPEPPPSAISAGVAVGMAAAAATPRSMRLETGSGSGSLPLLQPPALADRALARSLSH